MDVRRAIAALMLLGLLVSCSDDQPDSGTKEPTDSATVSPTPGTTASGPTEPTSPAGATSVNAAGAEAFLHYYWDMVEYAHATGDTQTLTSLAMPSCRPCKQGVSYIRGVYRDGGEIRGASFTVRVRGSRKGVSRGITLVFIDSVLALSPYRDFFGEGDARNKQWKGGKSSDEFVVEWDRDQDQWRMSTW